MKQILVYSLSLCVCTSTLAQNFGKPITVVAGQQGVFHHFEASGRTSMAVARGTLGIVWEDNSSGIPQVYVAFKDKAATRFSKPLQISTNGPAYEPSISAINDSFIIGWEANNQLWLRTVSSTTQAGPLLPISQADARQLTLTKTPQQYAVAAWSEKDKKSYHIRVAEISLNNGAIKMNNNRVVDHSTDRKEQLYPSVAVTPQGIVVGWEDRRQGATRIFSAFAPAGKAFEPYQLLNDFRHPNLNRFGRGTGAMRIVLGCDQKSRVMAIWLDKRDFEQGYDVYAAYSDNGGRTFGKDEKVQDTLGDNTPQWHATLAINPAGSVIAAWDDTRDDTPDIWFSTRKNNQWSDDDVWPEGSGEGAQTQPVLLFDGETLHAAWLDRHNNKSTIRYLNKWALTQ